VFASVGDACVSGDESTGEAVELGELGQMQRVFGYVLNSIVSVFDWKTCFCVFLI
jgi:hypothetical protein